MSVYLANQPGAVVFAGNPVRYEFKTLGYVDSIPVYPQLTIRFLEKVKAGESLIFLLKPKTKQNIVVSLQAKPFPDASGTQFNDDSFSGDIYKYVALIAKQLNNNPVLASNFHLVVDGNALIVKANKPTDDVLFTLSKIPFNYKPEGNPSGVQPNPEVTTPNGPKSVQMEVSNLFHDPGNRPNYALAVELYIEEDYLAGKWSKVSDFKLNFDNQEAASVDVSSVLSSEIHQRVQLHFPDVFGPASVKSVDYIRRYYIRFAEMIGAPSKMGDWNNSEVKYVIGGGLSTEDSLTANFVDQLLTKPKFLNAWPNSKKLAAKDKEFLYFLDSSFVGQSRPPKLQQWFVGLTVNYTDGSNSGTQLVPWSEFISDSFGVYSIPCGYYQIGVQNFDAGKQVLSWDVYIQDVGFNKISEVRTFRLDRTCTAHSSKVMYFNNFGLPEFVHLHGETKKRVKTQRKLASKISVPDSSIEEGESETYNQKFTDGYRFNSGTLTREEADFARGLLTSSSVFVVDSGRYKPINIKPASFQLNTSFIPFTSISFDADVDISSKFYSDVFKEPVLTPIHDCGTTGFKIDTRGKDIVSFSKLSAGDNNGQWFKASYDPIKRAYFFPKPLTRPDGYEIGVTVTDSNGKDYKITQKHFVSQQTIVVEHWEDGPFTIIIGGDFVNEQYLYIDYDNGKGWVEYEVKQPNYLKANYSGARPRRVVIKGNCFERLQYFLMENNRASNVSGLEQLTNLKVVRLMGAIGTKGLNLDFSKMANLGSLLLDKGTIGSLRLGAHPKISNITISKSKISDSALLDLFRYLWKFRKYHNKSLGKWVHKTNVSPKDIDIAKEIGDIIKGTNGSGLGKYVGEGLNKYGWNFL